RNVLYSDSEIRGRQHSMNWIEGGLIAGGLASLLLLIMMAARLLSYRAAQSESGDECAFSPERYEPMVRLLADDDFEFLEKQPGYRPEIGAKLRRERREIFRLYLKELARDFQSLHAAARKLVAECPEQHAELVGLLMRQQVTFWKALAGIEI